MAAKRKIKVRARGKVRDLEPKRAKQVKGGTIGMSGSAQAAGQLSSMGNQLASSGGSATR